MVHRKKPYENRAWSLWKKMIGQQMALHAGLKYDEYGARWMKENSLYKPLPPDESPTGIVGIIVFDKVYHEKNPPDDPWFFGPYGWHIGKVMALDNPIPCTGKQGLWNVPEDVMSLISTHMYDIIAPCSRCHHGEHQK
jgi:hypothetical protein